MIVLSNTNSKDDVNIEKLYGKDALSSAEEFIKEHNIKPNRSYN